MLNHFMFTESLAIKTKPKPCVYYCCITYLSVSSDFSSTPSSPVTPTKHININNCDL